MAELGSHPGAWNTEPPVNTRLFITDVADRLKVSLSEMARAIKESRTLVWGVTRNDFPLRKDRRVIEDRLRAYLQTRGATDAELAALFFAQIKPVRARKPRAANKPANPQSEPDMLLPKQTLTAHAKRHFKLFTNPFDGEVTRDDQMFNGETVRYVRECCWQTARNAGFTAVVGESGSGKTTILADLEARLESEAPEVTVIRPGVLGMEESDRAGKMLKSADILSAIITRLAPQAAMPQALQARTAMAQRLLSASAQVGNVHLVVIEEAHGMPDSTMKHLKRMHEMRLGRRGLLGILLLAQTELKVRLADGLRTGGLREVAQRCEIVELLPLGNELQAYLECRATACGKPLAELITPDAVDQLRTRLTKRLAHGAVDLTYPLVVGNACTKAMNQAAEIGMPLVTADVMKAI